MRIFRSSLCALPILALHGCGLIAGAIQKPPECKVSYTDNRYQYGGNITDFPNVDVKKLSHSKLGVPIGPGVDGDKVDAAFENISKCLGMEFDSCGVRAVMIAPTTQMLLGENVFPCALTKETAPLHAPMVRETYRGIEHDQYFCTGVNQWPATIFITPDHHSISWEVERMLLKDTPSKDPNHCWQTPGAP